MPIIYIDELFTKYYEARLSHIILSQVDQTENIY